MKNAFGDKIDGALLQVSGDHEDFPRVPRMSARSSSQLAGSGKESTALVQCEF